MKILIVLTSHDELGKTGEKTGFWLEELATPYYYFIDNGAEVTLASPKGGQPPIDPKSSAPEGETENTKRFNSDTKAMTLLGKTKTLSEIKFEEFDGVFYPGGHGPMWDLAEDKNSIHLIENFYNAGKPVAAVCHAPAALLHAEIDGVPLVKGKRVSGFTNGEEEGVKLTKVVPFLLEDELKRLGGNYEKGNDWGSFSVVDDLLVTGQNPGSSKEVAEKFLSLLKEKENKFDRSRSSNKQDTNSASA
jgi:putative intracellular protease/amidase